MEDEHNSEGSYINESNSENGYMRSSQSPDMEINTVVGYGSNPNPETNFDSSNNFANSYNRSISPILDTNLDPVINASNSFATITAAVLTLGELFAIATTATTSITVVGTVSIVGVAFAAPFAIMGIGIGTYGLITSLTGNYDEKEIEKYDMIKDPAMTTGMIVSDLLGSNREDATKIGKTVSAYWSYAKVTKDLKDIIMDYKQSGDNLQKLKGLSNVEQALSAKEALEKERLKEKDKINMSFCPK